ncbi:adenylyltransferase [bacterium F11]|nr:adenylyltransferase [bacterium F11]
MELDQSDKKRYHRQMMMDHWGEDIQKKLKNETVLIVGAGGLGSPTAIYLAVAGIGHIRICDFDKLELSNLNRQILHDDSRIDTKKALSAKATLEKINPAIKITPVEEKIESHNVDAIVGEASLIVDCLDNFPTRFLLNECAIRKKIPLVHASVWGMDGRLTFIHAPYTPCLKCLYPEGPPKELFPVLGATPGVMGSLQALEVVKFLTGIGENLKGRLLIWDGALMNFSTFKIRKDPNCTSCQNKASVPSPT